MTERYFGGEAFYSIRPFMQTSSARDPSPHSFQGKIYNNIPQYIDVVMWEINSPNVDIDLNLGACF